MLDEKAREQFRAWGAAGGKAKAKKYTKRELSLMARRGRLEAKKKRAKHAQNSKKPVNGKRTKRAT